MQFEPYFSSTPLCDTAIQAVADGLSPKLFYDPLNRVYRTDLPDGTFTKTQWTAWEQIIWDQNDTVKVWNDVLAEFEYSDWYKARAIVNGITGAL